MIRLGRLPDVFLDAEVVRNFDRAIEAKVMHALIPDRQDRAIWQAEAAGITWLRDALLANA